MSSEFDTHLLSSPTRVLFANLSSPLAEVCHRVIADQRDVQCVREVNDADDIDVIFAVKDTNSDVILLGAPKATPTPGICSHLLSEFPHLKIIVVPSEENSIAIYWLGVQHHRFADTDSQQLLRIIRLLRAFET